MVQYGLYGLARNIFFLLELILMPLFLWGKTDINTKYPILGMLTLDIEDSNSRSLSKPSKEMI